MDQTDCNERPGAKRSRISASASSEDGNPTGNGNSSARKQRGRPKIDTQDETAADRRRTQIRLAQRAYRQRKEATIGTLKNQVMTLQSHIESMHAAFLRFHDAALASGIYDLRPHLAKEMREVTEIFVKCARDANGLESQEGSERREGSDDTAADEEVVRGPPSVEGISPHDPQHPASEMIKGPPVQVGYYPHQQLWPHHETAEEQEMMDIWHSAVASSQPLNPAPTALHASSYQPGTLANPQDYQHSAALPFGMVAASSTSGSIAASPLPTPSQTLESQLTTRPHSASPWTYSVHESTFSRRLTRAALEKGNIPYSQNQYT